MPQRPWSYLINTFEVNTRNNYKKAMLIGEDHKAKLLTHAADPDIAGLSLTYDPVFNSFKTIDQNLNSVLGTYKGKTQTVEEFFIELSKIKLPVWEGMVHGVYPEGTPGDTNLFPNKRKPFNDGTYESRISAIKVLGDKCALDAALVPASVNILSFHNQIDSARLSQQSDGEGAVDSLRLLRENQRIALCQELYGDLGFLMRKHKTNPNLVTQYFELSYLREGPDNVIQFIVNPQQVVNLTDLAVAADVAGIKIKNASMEDSPVIVGYGTSTSQAPQGTSVIVQTTQAVVLDEDIIGPFQPFLNLFNNGTHAAIIEVTGL